MLPRIPCCAAPASRTVSRGRVLLPSAGWWSSAFLPGNVVARDCLLIPSGLIRVDLGVLGECETISHFCDSRSGSLARTRRISNVSIAAWVGCRWSRSDSTQAPPACVHPSRLVDLNEISAKPTAVQRSNPGFALGSAAQVALSTLRRVDSVARLGECFRHVLTRLHWRPRRSRSERAQTH